MSLVEYIIMSVIMGLLGGFVIGVIISIILKFRGSPMKSTLKNSIISASIILTLFIGFASVINYYEDKPYIEDMAKEFEESKKNANKTSVNNILVRHYFQVLKETQI